MARLRVAVVGVGHLGQHHARIMAKLPDVKLVGVADTRPEQARAIADLHGTLAFADYRVLLDQVDAVSVAVPTALHREVAGAFLGRGIATMVEKPLATSLAEAEELVSLARARRTVLQVGHIERFNPALKALDGLDLRPKYIAAERLSTYTFRSTDIGAVLDIMIHDLDLVLARVGAPVRAVSAVGFSVFGGHEDIANARIEFEDGCVANLTASRVSFQTVREMRLWGEEGYASLDFANKTGTIIRPSEALRRGELSLEGVDVSKPAAVKEHLFGTILHLDQVKTDGDEPLALELANFVRAARGEERSATSGDDALRAMRVADQVLQSLNGHQWDAAAADRAGQIAAAAPTADPAHRLRGPISWRLRGGRGVASDSGARADSGR